MTTNQTPVAKSLHTITVIVQVARLHYIRDDSTYEGAVYDAMDTLGLAGRPDPYGLRARALAQLEAGK
jgi:hypothetical protein